MIIRRTRESVFMEMAQILALRGTCDRKQVGAIITHAGRAVSWGYNGAPPGAPHCDEVNHGWGPTYSDLPEGCRNAIHAEANALAFAAREGISTDRTVLYVTLSPCLNCSQLLIAAGIRQVWYNEKYRDESGIELLVLTGVGVDQI